MHPKPKVPLAVPASGAPFLPLAFRFAASFGLAVLHLALPLDPVRPPVGELLYLACLALFFAESAWEASRILALKGQPFATPSVGWIRFNLLFDILFVAFIISFQGVDQERFATVYLFPVLASAFYLRIPEIVGIGTLSALAHVATVLLFTSGLLPSFGRSGPDLDPEAAQRTFILGFASLQIFAATLVVVLIRKHLETLRQTLSQSEATVDVLSNLYRRVFESMFSGLITTDLDGRITSANPAAEFILQRNLVPGTALDQLDIVNLRLHGNLPKEQRFERTFTSPDGQSRIIGGNVAPLRDAEGFQTGHLLLFQDLTELKALEERTRMSERLAAVGELSSELAHEMRNPLASIMGCVQILKQGEQPPPMMERVLAILRRESERVNDLVSGFLDFSKPRPVRLQPLWLPALVEEAKASFEIDPRNEALLLRIEEAPPLWIQGDPVCAHQVFGNLLSNARKALRTQAFPTLKLNFRQEQACVVGEISDNGCGMGPDQLRSIFLPFSSGFDEGTGLGMSLVFQFVQRMGWDIAVDSEPQEGTTIRLRIPVLPPPLESDEET
jgi:two-component system sensor histidine kinase PilS (NtrC family)